MTAGQENSHAVSGTGIGRGQGGTWPVHQSECRIPDMRRENRPCRPTPRHPRVEDTWNHLAIFSPIDYRKDKDRAS